MVTEILSGWFYPTKPAWTTKHLREQGSYNNFSWVQVSSTLLNLLQPPKSWGNKDHTTISHEFRLAQPYWTCLNHWALERRRIIWYLFTCWGDSTLFGVVHLYWTCMIHRELEGTRMIQKFLMSYFTYDPSSTITRQLKLFGFIEPFWNHEKLSCDLCSFNYSVVQAVWLGWMTLNSLEIMLWFFSPQ